MRLTNFMRGWAGGNGFVIDANGIIMSGNRFKGQPIWVPFYWDKHLLGDGGLHNGTLLSHNPSRHSNGYVFKLDDADRTLLGLDASEVCVVEDYPVEPNTVGKVRGFYVAHGSLMDKATEGMPLMTAEETL